MIRINVSLYSLEDLGSLSLDEQGRFACGKIQAGGRRFITERML